MIQPSGPQEGSSTDDILVTARPGEPPIVEEALTLAARITLYHETLGTDKGVVQKLILLKTRRQNKRTAVEKFNPARQDNVIRIAGENSQKTGHEWEWTDWNVGCYLASGLIRQEDLDLATRLTPEEIKEIENGENVGSRLICAETV